MNTKVSIIVPVYNVEQYIEKCLNSLVSQTIDNYEIIIVVDGSKDGSINIVRKFYNEYPEIISYYETSNKGLSAARNYGIKKAKGEYIGFIDSDDYISEKMFEKMYNYAINNECDVVVCNYYKVTEEETNEMLLDISKTDRKEDIIIKAKPYAWNKIYKRELFEKCDIEFPEGLIFEDICTVYPLLMQAEKIGYVKEGLYYYIYDRKDSIMNKKKRNDFAMLEVLNRLNTYCKEQELFLIYNKLIYDINVRHIYYRMREVNKYKNTRKYNSKFIYESFKLLKNSFPRWRSESQYAKEMNVIKKNMLCWQIKVLLGV